MTPGEEKNKKSHEKQVAGPYLLRSLGEERLGGLEQLPRGAVGCPLSPGHG